MSIRIFVPVFLLVLFPAVPITAQTDTTFNQTDANELKQGWWKKTYPNGKLMYKGYFKDNKPVGEMRRYYESGSIKAVLNYDANSEYIHARLHYENGQLAADGCYYNSLKDSIWLYYSYYDKTLNAKETYEKGARNGLMILYYNNGDISERIEWKNNQKHGIWEQYFAGKILKLKGNYTDNKLQGDFVINYENGEPCIKGKYLNDQRDGTWIFYNEDGTVDMELTYLNGKTKDENRLDDKQQELFRMIDENQGKFDEPDETDFLVPQGR